MGGHADDAGHHGGDERRAEQDRDRRDPPAAGLNGPAGAECDGDHVHDRPREQAGAEGHERIPEVLPRIPSCVLLRAHEDRRRDRESRCCRAHQRSDNQRHEPPGDRLPWRRVWGRGVGGNGRWGDEHASIIRI